MEREEEMILDMRKTFVVTLQENVIGSKPERYRITPQKAWAIRDLLRPEWKKEQKEKEKSKGRVTIDQFIGEEDNESDVR